MRSKENNRWYGCITCLSMVRVGVHTIVVVTATIAVDIVVYTVAIDTQHKEQNKHTHMNA